MIVYYPGVASCPQTPLYGGMAEQVDATDFRPRRPKKESASWETVRVEAG